MATKEKPVSEDVSKDTEQQQASVNQALVQVSGDGDVSGPMSAALALSTDKQDELMLALQEAMHRVTEGFATLTAPRDLYPMGLSFDVIDAITINDFEDKSKGEILTKHIFKLECSDGLIRYVMQSDAGPRRVIAEMFQKARALQKRIVAGPYKFEEKAVKGQIAPAYIFAQQKGFAASVVN